MLEMSFNCVRHYLHFDSRVHNESNRIWVFWNVGSTTTIIDDQIQFLYVRVKNPKLARPIYFLPVYAACEPSVRRDLWASLHHIFLSMDDP